MGEDVGPGDGFVETLGAALSVGNWDGPAESLGATLSVGAWDDPADSLGATLTEGVSDRAQKIMGLWVGVPVEVEVLDDLDLDDFEVIVAAPVG